MKKIFTILILIINVEQALSTDFFARKSGDWIDTTVWSLVDTGGGVGGASCSCTPTANDNVFINGFTIDIIGDIYITDITVYAGGVLEWANSSSRLHLKNGGTVDVKSGGIIWSLSLAASETRDINIDDPGIYTFIADGFFEAGNDLEFQANNATINLFGSGKFSTYDDLSFKADNCIFNNFHNDTVVIGDDIKSYAVNSVLNNDFGKMKVVDRVTLSQSIKPSLEIINDGYFIARDIYLIRNRSKLTINGSGVNYVERFVRMFGARSNFILNGTGSTTIKLDLEFNFDKCKVHNLSNLNIERDVVYTSLQDSLVNDGNLYVLGDFDRNSAVDGVVYNNSFASIQGDFIAVGGSSTWNNLTNSTLEIGHRASIPFTWDFNCSSTGNTVDYFRIGDQTIYIPNDTSYWNLTTSNTGKKTAENDLDINGDLLVRDSSELDVSVNNYFINIAGNWTDSSFFNERLGTVVYDGMADQFLTAIGGEIYFNKVINKSSGGVYLNDSSIIKVNGFLNLLNGLVYSSNNALMIIQDGASSNEGNSGSYVSGPMKKYGLTNFVFPIGKSNYWARIGISNLTTSSPFVAEYFNFPYTDIVNINTSTLNRVSNIEYWSLNGKTSAEATLYWEDNVRSGINSFSDLVVAQYRSGVWENEGQSNIVSGFSGNVTSALINSFNPYLTFGTTNEDDLMNIKIVNFSAKEDDEKIILNIELSEKLNQEDVLILERSIDGHQFSLVDRFTEDKSNFYFKDAVLEGKGQIYYKLTLYSENKIVDSKHTSIKLHNSNFDFKIYPNPFFEKVKVDVINNQGDYLHLSLYNAKGDILYNGHVEQFKLQEIINENLKTFSKGNYTICIEDEDKKVIKNILKN